MSFGSNNEKGDKLTRAYDQKILILGLDGATWELIRPWAEEGYLPTFRKLMKIGAWGNLQSCIPPITLPAWICMLTGKNPGKIGYIHFFARDPNSYEFKIVQPKIEPLNPLWKLLKIGKDSKNVLLWIPTIPRDKYMDIYLPGEFVFGKVRLSALEKKLQECIKVNDPPPSKHDVEYILWWTKYSEKQLDAIKRIIMTDEEDYPWDFIIGVIYSSDHINHLFWKYIDAAHPNYQERRDIYDAIKRYYTSIDAKLGKIVEVCQKKKFFLFIVSDHGHGPLKWRVNLNRWLINCGYMKIASFGSKRVSSKLFHYFIRKLASNAIIYRIYKKMPTVIKELIAEKIKPPTRIKTDGIDWNETRAYFAGYNGININLKGREPKGIVDQTEYPKLLNELKEKLNALSDSETKESIVEKVWTKYELYSGDRLEYLPDLIIQYKNESLYESALGFDEPFLTNAPLFYPVDVSSAHRRNGIFLAYGPSIKHGEKIDIKIYDLTPTILHIFGLPIPSDIDGEVVLEIFEKDSIIVDRKPTYVEPGYYEKELIKKKIKEIRKSIK